MSFVPQFCYYLLSHQNSPTDQMSQTAKAYVLLSIKAEVPQHSVQFAVLHCLVHHYQPFGTSPASIFTVEEGGGGGMASALG
jgi:hypothetical protein